MPFCPSCGAETVPGNRFCVECGAPVDATTPPATPQVTPVPGTPTPPPRPGMHRMTMILVAAAAICVIIAAIVLTGMTLSKSGSFSAASAPPVSAVPTGYAVVLTPTPTPTATPTPTFTPNIQHSERFGSDYLQVYKLSQNFSYGQKESFTHNLTSPPLYIRFALDPVMINRHVISNIGTSIEHMINTTEVSPDAWFEVKVFDARNGALVDQQGFGKDYSDVPTQEFMVREPGSYRIEMSGHEVFANVSVMTGVP